MLNTQKLLPSFLFIDPKMLDFFFLLLDQKKNKKHPLRQDTKILNNLILDIKIYNLLFLDPQMLHYFYFFLLQANVLVFTYQPQNAQIFTPRPKMLYILVCGEL